MEYTNDMLNTYVLPFDVNRMFRQVGEARQADPVGTHSCGKNCGWRERTLLIIWGT